MSSPFAAVALHSAGGARAEACAYGAHTLRWQPAGDGDERLYLSRSAVYRAGQAIRGGVPVLFPQFGLFGDGPKHGFLRQRCWSRLESGTDRLLWGCEDDTDSRVLWPGRFRATLEVRLLDRALTLTLTLDNRGSAPFRFTAGLHTYLSVADTRTTRLHGLSGLRYLDATRGLAEMREGSASPAFDHEIDRVYCEALTPLELDDGLHRTQVTQHGFRDVVVWNPGAEKAGALTDVGADDERYFVCVEAAAIAQPVELSPGERWQGSQTLTALT